MAGLWMLACALPSAGAHTSLDNGATAEAIAARDQLIADQEALLNAYRCRFDIDTHIVPGGCAGGKPLLEPAPPGALEHPPTPADVAARDKLIADQEVLLNAYRCRFDIDTHIVPGGCIGFRFDPDASSNQIENPSPNAAISAGGNHVCLIRDLGSDGAIECWGDNGVGQTDSPHGQYTAIAAGQGHTCAIAADQSIECWGDNGVGQTDSPHGQYTAIAAGQGHTCAIAADQSIACWGSSEYGQADPPGGRFTGVTSGDVHSCGLRASGEVDCWGNNELGQSDPPDGSLYTAISAGWGHTCGLRASGEVDCWGNNGHRQSKAPAGAFTLIATGDVHSCGLRADGTVDCWGFFGFYGRQVYSPERTFTVVAAGESFSCGLLGDGAIFCWGRVGFAIGSRYGGPGPLVEWQPGQVSFFA